MRTATCDGPPRRLLSTASNGRPETPSHVCECGSGVDGFYIHLWREASIDFFPLFLPSPACAAWARARVRVSLFQVSGKAVRQHRVDLMLLRLADVSTMAQLTLGARRLRAEVVAEIRPLPLDAPLGGQLEALLRATVRLHLVLGHARRRSISISRLWASICRMASAWRETGVKPGDQVGAVAAGHRQLDQEGGPPAGPNHDAGAEARHERAELEIGRGVHAQVNAGGERGRPAQAQPDLGQGDRLESPVRLAAHDVERRRQRQASVDDPA